MNSVSETRDDVRSDDATSKDAERLTSMIRDVEAIQEGLELALCQVAFDLSRFDTADDRAAVIESIRKSTLESLREAIGLRALAAMYKSHVSEDHA